MAEIKTFETPEFLKNRIESTIHNRMLAIIREKNPNMDITEGSVAWDFTRPTAREIARMVGFNLTEAIKNMFPMWGYDTNLDWMASIRGMERKAAKAATGTLTIVGRAGTAIPAGFLFCTEKKYDNPKILFKTLETVVIPGAGAGQSVTVPIEADSPGLSGIVAAGTITMLNMPLAGIESVTNESDTINGSDTETDDALRDRIVDYDQKQGISFIGSDTDYKRWAMEVQGVGGAAVIPASAGSEIVTVVLTDTIGQPATTELCTAVYNHIIAPDNRQNRLAGINDILVVIPATAVPILISVTVITENGRSLADIKGDFYTALFEYYKTAAKQNVVRINEVGVVLIEIPGVADYSNLILNGATANIAIASGAIPMTTMENITVN